MAHYTKKVYSILLTFYIFCESIEVKSQGVDSDGPIIISPENYKGIDITYDPFVEVFTSILKKVDFYSSQGKVHFVPKVIFKKNVPNNPFYNIFSQRNKSWFEESLKQEVYQTNSTERILQRIQKSIKNDVSTMRNTPLDITLNSSHRTAIQTETTEKPPLRFEDLEPLSTSGSFFGTLFPNCSKITSGSGSPCIFPFILYTKTFYHCTTQNDFDDLSHPLWCSTKTDSQDHHIAGQGHWGNCDPKCNYFIFLANLIFDQATQNIDCPIESCVNFNYCSPFVNKMHEIQATYNTKDVSKLSNYVCDKKEYKICCNSPNKSSERTKEAETTTTAIASSTFSLEYLYSLRPIVLTLNESKIIDTQSSSDGRWLPSPKNLECSKDISYPNGFIVRGKETKIGGFPHTALLGYFIKAHNSTYYLCGGTLINRKYVLTAAHCHNPLISDESIVEVVIGEWDVTTDPDCLDCKPAQRFKIENGDVIRHDQWSFDTFLTVGNDIALIRLPQTVVTFFEDTKILVLPACLDWRNPEDTISPDEVSEEKFILTGWGRTTNDDKKTNKEYAKYGVSQTRLIQTNVQFIQKSQCQDYRVYRRIAENHICFNGYENSDSCEGDSGGGVVKLKEFQMILQAIVSFGTDKCGKGIPGVYTNIKDYIPWIIRNLKE